MDRIVRQFLKRVESNQYMSQFIPDAPFVADLQTKDTSYKFFISKEKIEMVESNTNAKVDITLTADVDVMKKAVQGLQRLRKIQKYEMIKIEGSFRAVLFIEALMWLCREKKAIEKIA